MTTLRKFIKDNDLSFMTGERNSTVTTLIGFAQYLGLRKDNLEAELQKEIENDNFIQTEIDRLWSYCERNNYALWWKNNPEAKHYEYEEVNS